MDAFDPIPPAWTQSAVHAARFCCPTCGASSQAAQQVWINRRSPVFDRDNRHQWQEFYLCKCERAWWAWSLDRPPSNLARVEQEPFPDPLEDE
ncbi:MAG: hypothetical protein ACKO24_16420 [Leptolyngbyaceae cyanobacterium]